MTDDAHDNPYERGLRDTAFLNAVRAAHVGRWKVLDALWWQSHPLSPGPGGTPSPSARLRDLQHQAFSVDGDAVGDQATAERIRALEAEIADERKSIANALDAARNPSRLRVARPLGDLAQPDDSVLETPFEITDEATAMGISTARGRYLVAAGIVVALAFGGVVGAQLATGNAGAAPPEATRSATPTPEPLGALSVFDRAQSTEDLPTQPVTDTFDLASFRSLGVTAGTSTSTNRVSVYAAKSTSKMICLVALAAEFDHLATCALAGDFPSTGLRLYWQSDFDFETADGTLSPGRLDWYVTWMPDGTVESGGVGRGSVAP